MKKIKIGALVLLLGGVFAFNNSFNREGEKYSNMDLSLLFSLTEAQAESPTPGVSCYCGKTYGAGCKADNAGKRCNPEGTSKCWEWDRNCS